MKRSLLLTTILGGILSFVSCNNDDDNVTFSTIRERGPQNALDANYINNFLDNYTYNNISFEDDSSLDHKKIEFIRIKDENGAPIPLTDEQGKKSNGESLRTKIQTIDFATFGVNYKLHYIVVRQGEGKEVAISDDIYTSFKGSVIGIPGSVNQTASQALLSEKSFIDTNELFWLNGFRVQDRSVARTGNLRVEGFSQIQSKFKTARLINPEQPCSVTTFDINGNPSKTDFGVGIMIIPSGLGFYEQSMANTPLLPYSNIIYTFSLFNNEPNDLDRDGISDLMEGVNQIKNPIDTDGDGIENYLDNDDDNDERLTINEIDFNDLNLSVDYDCDGVIDNDLQLVLPLRDTNKNQIPNYLDFNE